MPFPFPHLPPSHRGRIETWISKSLALQGNYWRDPSDREVFIWKPAGFSLQEHLPAVLFLPGFAGTGEQMLARGLSDIPLSSRCDRWVNEGTLRFIAVMPDTMTSLGGSQFVDSAGIGHYRTWLVDELIPELTIAFGISNWGVVGRSSGGFGALHLALTAPSVFDAIACHAPDLGFDSCYLGDMIPAIRGIASAGGIEQLIERFWSSHSPDSSLFAAMNILCMSCAYSPNTDRFPIPADLPFDPVTGEMNFEILQRWKAFDPLHRELSPLRALKMLYLDCGNRDEYLLHFGARRLVKRLITEGIDHQYEEFAGGHRGTGWRYDVSIPKLVAALST